MSTASDHESAKRKYPCRRHREEYQAPRAFPKSRLLLPSMSELQCPACGDFVDGDDLGHHLAAREARGYQDGKGGTQKDVSCGSERVSESFHSCLPLGTGDGWSIRLLQAFPYNRCRIDSHEEKTRGVY